MPSPRSLLRRLLPEPVRGGLRRVLRPPQPAAAALLARLPLPDDAIFVQVGSNDGKQGDPIHDLVRARRWRGVLIEPVPAIYRRLVANYPDAGRFTCVNVAIGPAGERPFFSVAPEAQAALDLPYWFDQLGSFDRNHIVGELGERIVPFVRETAVTCKPLMRVVAEAGFSAIDLLHVDTEGYDYEVLRQVDFGVLDPSVVLYEHKHLGPADAAAAQALLRRHGYRVRRLRDDTLATKPRAAR